MLEQLLAHLWGDYILQSDWMEQNKTKHWRPALVHAFLYSLLFAWLCWVPGIAGRIEQNVLNGPCVTYVDKNGGESQCLVTPPADAVGFKVYAAPPTFIPSIPGRFRWLPWFVILGTHFLIDRYRLARYVVWAKNFMAPKGSVTGRWNGQEQRSYPRRNWDWQSCAESGGYAPNAPAFMWVWLMIIADNTLHLTINYLALRYL